MNLQQVKFLYIILFFVGVTSIFIIWGTYILIMDTSQISLSLPILKKPNYVIKNKMCETNETDTIAIILITSHVDNVELRKSHRHSISESVFHKMGFKRVFLLARLPNIPKPNSIVTQETIMAEQEVYGDILQFDFAESYQHLSNKHIMGLEWAVTECSFAKFIIKMNDDTVFNIYAIYNYLSNWHSSNNYTLLAGYPMRHKKPNRQIFQKNFVSESEYSGTKYPTYLLSSFYITNLATAERLVEEASKMRAFKLDDVWITGMLRSKLNISIEDLSQWYMFKSINIDDCIFNYRKRMDKCAGLVGIHVHYKKIHNFMVSLNYCQRVGFQDYSQAEVSKGNPALPEYNTAPLLANITSLEVNKISLEGNTTSLAVNTTSIQVNTAPLVANRTSFVTNITLARNDSK